MKQKTLIIIVIILLVSIVGALISTKYPKEQEDIIISNNSRKILWSNITMETKPTNASLIIYCNHYQDYENALAYTSSQFFWIYPICAILETNSELELYNYNIKFEEYNICMYLMNNKSVGDCRI